MSEAWRNFCRPDANWLRAGAIAVQTLWRPLLTHGTEVGSKALVQFRGTSWIEATFESGYTSIRVGR
jgi:hypothetical protein